LHQPLGFQRRDAIRNVVLRLRHVTFNVAAEKSGPLSGLHDLTILATLFKNRG